MKTELRFLSDSEVEIWDRWQQYDMRGHYGVLSTWLASYQSYGASWKILGLFDDSELKGGIGLVIFGKGPFKIVIAPYGPTLSKGYDTYADEVLDAALEFAKQIHAFLFEIKIPFNREYGNIFLETLPQKTSKMRKGYPFKSVKVANLLYLVDLHSNFDYGEEWEKAMFDSFNTNTKRNIRKGLKYELEFKTVSTPEELKEAYGLIEETARNKGYAVRAYQEFRPTMERQISERHAVMSVVKKDGEVLASHYGVIAGRRLGYSMGGTRRTEVDYKSGHFLHWNVMILAKKMGLDAYDFTSLGPEGVLRFKSGFNPMLYTFDTEYYKILSRPKYLLFDRLFPLMQRHKKTLARLAYRMSGKRG